MKKVQIIFLYSLLFSTSLFSQISETLLYNKKGQLRADTSLSISSIQITKWGSIEDLLIKEIIDKVKYSPLASEEKLNGISIVSFEIDSSGKLSNYKIIKEVGGGLEIQIKICFKSSNLLTTLAPSKGQFTYYIAIKFQSINANDFIKKENSIPIINISFDYIVH